MEPIITTATLGKLILGATIGFFVKEVLNGDENKTQHSHDTNSGWEDDSRPDCEGNYPDWNG